MIMPVTFGPRSNIKRIKYKSDLPISLISMVWINVWFTVGGKKTNLFDFVLPTCADVFTINVTTEKNCEVRLKETKLDHEHAESYQLKIRLDTLAGVVNPSKSTTMVSVYVHIAGVRWNFPFGEVKRFL